MWTNSALWNLGSAYCVSGAINASSVAAIKLDDETKGSTQFRIPTALSCSVSSAARTLLRARGILDPGPLADAPSTLAA